jgi:eukaryotic-like serine/threonine-protein kinase
VTTFFLEATEPCQFISALPPAWAAPRGARSPAPKGGETAVKVGVREGDVIAGKYRVERLIGAGAMGAVVAAKHLRLDRRVAIKLMLDASLRQPELVARFVREARAAAQINSEHVARVLDVGELESGAPFIVMEYLEGEDLAALLARRGRLPVAEAVGYLLEACEAVAEAHRAGIVHRDLKPDNLFLAKRRDGSSVVKVLDFGVAKTSGDEGARAGLGLTTALTVLGSPLYMPPEQLRASRDVDGRADIWSLGVILYELLSGTTPFGGGDFDELVADVTTNDPRPLKRRDVPAGLGAAIKRCLSRSRKGRFDNVALLAEALAPFGPPGAQMAAERVRGVLFGSAPPPSDAPRASTAPLAVANLANAALPPPRPLLRSAKSTPPSSPPARWSPVPLLLSAAAACAALGLGGVALKRSTFDGAPSLRVGVASDLRWAPSVAAPASFDSTAPSAPAVLATTTAAAAAIGGATVGALGATTAGATVGVLGATAASAPAATTASAPAAAPGPASGGPDPSARSLQKATPSADTLSPGVVYGR